ncbi:hypothetical protein [Sphingobacterium sp. LRF_L2]|uniref:hypothetical protein n=1 Tax=Sphingobacterium sp. LRF_L2 TaxID=3369421 RepID=UPI003F61F185
MRALQFLVIGTHTEIVNTLKRLLEQQVEWSAQVLFDAEEAYTYIRKHKIDVILLSSGLTEAFEKDIKIYASSLQNGPQVILHYGGGSGLLKNEIFSLFPELIT